MKFLKGLWDGLLHLAYPEVCYGCLKEEVRRGGILCIKCLYKLPYTDHFEQEHNNAFENHFVGRVPFKRGAALFIYSEIVENLVHKFKYEDMTFIGRKYGKEIGEKINKGIGFPKIDLIIPVPLHPSKLRKRGYNQSKILAEAIGQSLAIPVNDRLLIKKKKTKSQTKKTRLARISNLNAVFSGTDCDVPKDSHLLIVDDVLTTGATLEACILALVEKGYENFSMATLAIGDSL